MTLRMRLDGARGVRAEQVDEPIAGPGTVLLRVDEANLCPTDARKWADPTLPRRLRGAPLVLGHEFAGTVVSAGPDVSGWDAGDRVAVDPIIRCGRCPYCSTGETILCERLTGVGAAAGDPLACAELLRTHGIGGAFAERVLVPAANLIRLPADVDQAAGSLVEPLADVLSSIEVSGAERGDTAAVIGLGPMGLLHLQALRAAGITAVGADIRPDRRATARRLGHDATAPARLPRARHVFVVAGGPGFDPAFALAQSALTRGGTIVLFASAPRGAHVELDPNVLHYSRSRIVGVVGFEARHADAAVRMLGAGAIDVASLRQPVFELADLQRAFESLGALGAMKPAITMTATPPNVHRGES